MTLMWESLARQLDRVRAGADDALNSVIATTSVSRKVRLEAALAAIQDKGSPMMIESLKAAIEGREPSFDMPEFPAGLEPKVSGPEAFLQSIDSPYKPEA